jgi:hypothetical protein
VDGVFCVLTKANCLLQRIREDDGEIRRMLRPFDGLYSVVQGKYCFWFFGVHKRYLKTDIQFGAQRVCTRVV